MLRMVVILISILASKAVASENIKILWPYAVGEIPWQSIKATADNANIKQNKYNFILEFKPGAGGGIAAQSTLKDPNNTLLANSATHIIRPLISKDSGYSIDQFMLMTIQAMDVPLLLVSKKHATFKELNDTRKLNIGISASGGITEYAARMMITKPDTQFVGFKTGFPEMMTAILGGHLDGGIASLESARRFLDSGSVVRLNDSSLSLYWAYFASVKMEEQRAKEIHTILTEASNQENVRKILEPASANQVRWSLPKLQEWYASEKVKWANITTKYPIAP